MKARRQVRERGSVFITAMWIVIALSAVMLVVCRSMVVEAMASAQHFRQAKLDAAELGVEQFVLAVMAGEVQTPGYKDQFQWDQQSIGDCYFWVIRPNAYDEETPDYGLEDEASRLDINTACRNDATNTSGGMLIMLPNITQDVVDSIIDWYDADDNVTGTDGAEDAYYMALDPPYHCKNAPFESLEELKLVNGVTDDLLWGADRNHNGTIEPNEMDSADTGMTFQSSMRGIMSYLTVYGGKATTPTSTSTSGTGTTGGTTGSTGTTIVNVNSGSQTNLQSLLQQYLPSKATQMVNATRTYLQGTTGGGGGRGGGAATGGRTFPNIWTWANAMSSPAAGGMTSQDFSQIFTMVTATATTTGGTGGTTTTTKTGRINVNTASEAVLMCLPGFTQTEADAIINYRETNSIDPTQIADISWLMDVVPVAKLSTAGNFITGSSTVYSADIVTVTNDGRSFKRVRITVDASSIVVDPNTGLITSGTPQIIHRVDLTTDGWPLDPAIRESLRNGNGLEQSGSRGSSSSGLSLGIR